MVLPKSRTTFAIQNISINLLLSLMSYIAVFVARTCFIRILGNDYLSIAGLFANLITLISFTELGLASASIYCLYKPISDNDYGKIHALLIYFGRLYKYVFLSSLIIGLAAIPLIPYMINMSELPFANNYLVLIYFLFVLNTSVSYLYVENKIFLIADQKTYIANAIQQLIHVVQLILQILYLIYTRDYVGYLMIQIVCTLSVNIVTSLYVKRKYVKIKAVFYEDIEGIEKKSITSNIISVFFYKIGAVVLNGTDNIIISSLIKTTLVGICSNYTLIINAINFVFIEGLSSVGASIGNHTILASKADQEKVFRKLDSLGVTIYSISSICIAVLLNPLISLWIGNEYLLPVPTLLALVLGFYISGVNQVPSLYRTSLGLFKKARIYPTIAAVVNIILSILLGEAMGVTGIFIATCIVRFICFTVVDSNMVYLYGFASSSLFYYVRYFIRILILIVGYLLIDHLCGFFVVENIQTILFNSVICFITTSIYVFIAYIWDKDFCSLIIVLYGKIKK